jgi:phosphoribosylanthranilate isomerase
MWLKICGMTDEAAVSAALGQGVDALGFVFAPSVRRLAPEQARRLAAPARGRAQCVAVTLHPSQELVDRILAQFGPDALQTDIGDFATLRLPPGLRLLPVVRAGAVAGAPAALPRRLLFEGPRSGSGTPPDWEQARRLALRTELVLAGGLQVCNIAQAIRAVRPFGIDVSSGVEAQPGRKEPRMIQEFVQAARAAAAEMTHDADPDRV